MTTPTVQLTAATDIETPAAQAVFQQLKEQVAKEGLLTKDAEFVGVDERTGIEDDGALGRFIRGHAFNIDSAFRQYKLTRAWRDNNHLLDLYNSIDVNDYEETRKMYTHWTGRRDRAGIPICWFEIAQLTPQVMEAYTTSCNNIRERPWKTTESEAMLRLFCTYENLIRFVLPLCTAIRQKGTGEKRSVTDTTCIVDIGNVGLMQFWRLKNHMSAASTLATANYPETLGRTFIIGAPGFFPTLWGWISKWFNQNTISKITIVPSGQELARLSEVIEPQNIPRKYGGEMEYTFGTPPDLDREIREAIKWEGELPLGPVVWRRTEEGRMEAVAVGSEGGEERRVKVGTLI